MSCSGFRRLLLRRSKLFGLLPRSDPFLLFPHKSALALYLRIALRRSRCAVLLNNKAVLGLDVAGYCMVGFYKLFRNILCSIAAVFLLPQQQFRTLRGAAHACIRCVLDPVAAISVRPLLPSGVPQLISQTVGAAVQPAPHQLLGRGTCFFLERSFRGRLLFDFPDFLSPPA